MLEEATARLLPLLKGLPATLIPLLSRGPGRPPIPDDPEAVLLSPRREAIFRLVRKEPGLSLSAIERRLEIPSGAFHGHIEKLLASGLVEKRYVGREARIYPSDKAPRQDAPPFTNPYAKAVGQMVLEKPGLTSAEIAEALNVTQRTAQIHLKNLLHAGYVNQEKTASAMIYLPLAKLRAELSRK